MKLTAEQLTRLPEWAQWYIKDLERRVRILGMIGFGLGVLLVTVAIYLASFPR